MRASPPNPTDCARSKVEQKSTEKTRLGDDRSSSRSDPSVPFRRSCGRRRVSPSVRMRTSVDANTTKSASPLQFKRGRKPQGEASSSFGRPPKREAPRKGACLGRSVGVRPVSHRTVFSPMAFLSVLSFSSCLREVQRLASFGSFGRFVFLSRVSEVSKRAWVRRKVRGNEKTAADERWSWMSAVGGRWWCLVKGELSKKDRLRADFAAPQQREGSEQTRRSVRNLAFIRLSECFQSTSSFRNPSALA